MSLNSVTNYATAFSGLALLARNAQWAHTYGVEAGNSSQFFGLALIMVAYVERYVPRQNTNRSSYWAFLCFCLRQSGFGAENGMVAMGNLVLGLFHLANAWSGSSKKEKMNGTQRQRMIYGTLLFMFCLDNAGVLMGYGDVMYGSSGDKSNIMTYTVCMVLCANLSHNPPKSTKDGVRAWFQWIVLGQCMLCIVFMHGLNPTAWFNHLGSKVYGIAVVGGLCFYAGNL